MVGWLVVMDGSTWCADCFATGLEAAAHWAGDDGDGVIVAPLNRSLAADLGVTCWLCSRRLACVKPR